MARADPITSVMISFKYCIWDITTFKSTFHLNCEEIQTWNCTLFFATLYRQYMGSLLWLPYTVYQLNLAKLIFGDSRKNYSWRNFN